MGNINSRTKGKIGELELSKVFKKYGYLNARRGQQYAGINGDADVVGLPKVHVECKRVEHLNIYSAMKQSIRDAKDDEVPIVFHRKNRQYWLVTMRLDDWMKMYKDAKYDSK